MLTLVTRAAARAVSSELSRVAAQRRTRGDHATADELDALARDYDMSIEPEA